MRTYLFASKDKGYAGAVRAYNANSLDEAKQLHSENSGGRPYLVCVGWLAEHSDELSAVSSTAPASLGVSADFIDQLRKVGARPEFVEALETDRERQARQAVEQTMPNADVSVAVLPRGEPNIGGYDGEIIQIDGVNRLIYCTAPSYNHKPGRTGWFWQQHNIGEHWVTMADACGMDAHVARLLVEANRRLAGRYAPAAAYVADENGVLQGPLTNQQLIEMIGDDY